MLSARAMTRRGYCASLAIGLFCALIPAAGAQGWKPSRPVAFIAPAAPGGSIDLTARLIQQIWDGAQTIGVPVVVIDKPGASGGIAWSFLNEHGGDGHSVAIGTINLVSNPVIGMPGVGYRDIKPIALMFEDYFVLVVPANSPLRSMTDVQQRLRADPASIAIGFGPGIGAGSHIAAAVAWKAMGIDVRKSRFVPYKSAGEALNAMLAGELDMVSGTAVNMPPFIAAGRTRPLAVIGPQRLTGPLAQVPTMREQGFDAVFTNWRGVVGPKGMRAEHVAYWQRALAVVNDSDAWRKELARNFWRAHFLTGRELDEFIAREAVTFRTLLTDLGLSKQK